MRGLAMLVGVAVMLAEWTWSQHAVAAALVTLYGAAFTSARIKKD